MRMRFEYDHQEMVSAWMQAQAHNPRVSWVYVIAWIVMVMGFMISGIYFAHEAVNYDLNRFHVVWLILLGISLLWILFENTLRRSWVLLHLKRYPKGECDWILLEEGLHVRSDPAHTLMPWEAFQMGYHLPHGFILQYDKFHFIWLPYHGLEHPYLAKPLLAWLEAKQMPMVEIPVIHSEFGEDVMNLPPEEMPLDWCVQDDGREAPPEDEQETKAL